MVLVLLRVWIRKRAWLWIIVALGVVFGALPDLIGAYGNIIEHDHWTLCRSAHFGEIKEVLQYVPMYRLHLYLDSIMHGPGQRWWKWDERLWLEIVLWIVNVIVIWWLIRSWRKE